MNPEEVLKEFSDVTVDLLAHTLVLTLKHSPAVVVVASGKVFATLVGAVYAAGGLELAEVAFRALAEAIESETGLAVRVVVAERQEGGK